MREQIARLLRECSFGNDWDELCECDKEVWRRDARVILAAVIEEIEKVPIIPPPQDETLDDMDATLRATLDAAHGLGGE